MREPSQQQLHLSTKQMEQGVAARQQPYNPLSQFQQFVTLTKSYQTTTISSQSPIAPGTTPSINRFTYSTSLLSSAATNATYF